MKKISLIVLSALALSGCGSVDEIINDALSGDVTTETIAAKAKVVIINNVGRTACVTIKNGLISNDFQNPEVLIAELGVNCATYSKTEGSITDPNASCYEEDLADWLEHESNGNITDLDSATGDNACVIGADI